jgi:hypothetical protein
MTGVAAGGKIKMVDRCTSRPYMAPVNRLRTKIFNPVNFAGFISSESIILHLPYGPQIFLPSL